MKCEDFADWLQETLDERNGLELPRDLKRHVQQCECCRGQLDAWEQIASILPTANLATGAPRPTVGQPNHRRIARVAGVVAVAAAVALIVSVVGQFGSESPKLAQAKTTQAVEEVGETNTAESSIAIVNVDPACWWQQLQSRDWIGQTMPTVQSVRQGVAPFRKPFMQAVSILTMGGQDQTS